MNKTRLLKLFWGIKISLVAAIVYVAAGAVVAPLRLDKALKPAQASGRESVKIAGNTTEEPTEAPDYSAVAGSHLFGESEPSLSSPAGDLKAPEPAPKEESLNLNLVGTLVVSNPEASQALIEDGKLKKTAPYKIGETVASATIESIEPDRVTLRYRGQTKTLTMKTSAAAPVAKAADPNGVRLPPGAVVTSTIQQPDAPSGRMAQVEALFHKATIEPYVEKGQTEGLRLTGLENIPAALAFGLRNGDVVQSVNGQALTSKQKAFQVLQKAKAQSKIDMQLLRDGKSTNLSFHTR
jgi:general secretion pathway protein C